MRQSRVCRNCLLQLQEWPQVEDQRNVPYSTTPESFNSCLCCTRSPDIDNVMHSTSGRRMGHVAKLCNSTDGCLHYHAESIAECNGLYCSHSCKYGRNTRHASFESADYFRKHRRTLNTAPKYCGAEGIRTLVDRQSEHSTTASSSYTSSSSASTSSSRSALTLCRDNFGPDNPLNGDSTSSSSSFVTHKTAAAASDLVLTQLSSDGDLQQGDLRLPVMEMSWGGWMLIFLLTLLLLLLPIVMPKTLLLQPPPAELLLIPMCIFLLLLSEALLKPASPAANYTTSPEVDTNSRFSTSSMPEKALQG